MTTKHTLYQLRKTIQTSLKFGYAKLEINNEYVLIVNGQNNILTFSIAKIESNITPKATGFFLSLNIADFNYQEFESSFKDITISIKPLVMQALFIIVAYNDLSVYEGKI